MRFAVLAVIAAGCGGRPAPPAAAPPSGLPGFAAARWVPERPLYLATGASVLDGQRAARDAIDLLAAATGFDLRDAMRNSTALFGVDALHPDPLAAIGVDLHGGWAVFGGDPSPTLVVHLAAPAEMAAFLARQRARVVTRTAVVDRVEVTSATLPIGATVSLAIDGDWMWIHLALPGTPDDGGRWFTASHAAHGASWTGDWAWAQRAAGAAASLVGILDLRGALAAGVARLPDAVACAHLAEPIGRISLAVEGDEHHVSARLGLDAGAAAIDRLRAMLLPAPTGWTAATAGAAIAAQWNLDLAAARPQLAPCLAAAGAQLGIADEAGVRAARAVLVNFDPDRTSGSGAIALDVTSPAFLDRQLDRIPLRHTLERARTFGPYRGHAISIPFSVTIEYVLDRQLAIAALGEGLVARLVAPGPAQPPPIAALDLAPPAMSARGWEAVIDGIAEGRIDGTPGPATRRAVAHLMAWRDAHLAVTADGGEIVVTASGRRR
ncbi:MAG TPA: hypothetical protein VK601_06995 [Kofleriaceae bacterium]|nr:hypothetical protein [Kofleriaceae bacterium]